MSKTGREEGRPAPPREGEGGAQDSERGQGQGARGVAWSTIFPLVSMAAVSAIGWIWHTENTLTSMQVRVADLEEQVDNYRSTEKTLIEVRVRLDDLQQTLRARASGREEKSP